MAGGQPTCISTGKVQYGSSYNAKIAARQMREKTGDKLTAYVCKACHCWHIGHTPFYKQRRYKLIKAGRLDLRHRKLFN
jgi:cytochrome c5